MNEIAGVYSKRVPPLSARKRCPASVNLTISTLPALPAGLSVTFFCTWSMRELGSRET